MKRVKKLQTVLLSVSTFALFASLSTASLAEEALTRVTRALDELTCLQDGFPASAAMIIRQYELPGNLKKADRAIKKDGIFDEGIHLSSDFYLVLAYRYPVERDKEAQRETFQEAATIACMGRLLELKEK